MWCHQTKMTNTDLLEFFWGAHVGALVRKTECMLMTWWWGALQIKEMWTEHTRSEVLDSALRASFLIVHGIICASAFTLHLMCMDIPKEPVDYDGHKGVFPRRYKRSRPLQVCIWVHPEWLCYLWHEMVLGFVFVSWLSLNIVLVVPQICASTGFCNWSLCE